MVYYYRKWEDFCSLNTNVLGKGKNAFSLQLGINNRKVGTFWTMKIK